MPHNVDLLYCTNDKVLNLTQQLIFVHSSTMGNVSGFYYNAIDCLGKLIPCPEPPSGALHVIHRDQLWFTLCDDLNSLPKHSHERLRPLSKLVYDNYKDDRYSWHMTDICDG